MLDGEFMADHMFKTKTQIIPYDHMSSECQDNVICHIQSAHGAKKRTDVDCGPGGIAASVR